MKRIRVELGKRSYNIEILTNGLKYLPTCLKKINVPENTMILTTETVSSLYQEKISKILKENDFEVFFEIVPDGEKSKSFIQLKKSINNISYNMKSKPFFLVSLGGGVIGDLSGFIASIYKRGIEYIQIPTTLLSQVDSSIGGKVGIDLENGKNLVGAFYQPKLVFSDISFLETLTEREIRSGMAEIIKYGMLKDEKIFFMLEDLNRIEREENKIFLKIKNILEELVFRCAEIKSGLVSLDERDVKGIRVKLNLGHTIGHAIEAASNYSNRYNHGEAISIGMMCAVEISKELGILKEYVVERLDNLLRSYNLPVYARGLNLEDIIKYFWYDKKFISGKPRMVLPVKIGQVKVVEDVSIDIIKRVLKNRIKDKVQ